MNGEPAKRHLATRVAPKFWWIVVGMVCLCLLVPAAALADPQGRDDSLPGIPAGPGVLKGVVLEEDSNTYCTFLAAGHEFTMTMKPDELGHAECNAALWRAPGGYLARTTELTHTATYTPTVSGIYYFTVHWPTMYPGFADYELTVTGCYHPGSLTHWSQGVDSQANVSPKYSLTPAYGEETGLAFTVMPTFTTYPLYFTTADLFFSDDRTTWKPAPAPASPSGTFYPKVKSYTKRYYRMRWDGDYYYAPSTSGIVTVTPKVRMTRATSWRTISHDTIYYAKGFIEPRHSSGDKNKVKIRAYKKRANGKYRYVKSFTASYSYYSSTKTRYKARVVLGSTGSWKLVAYHAADRRNARSLGRPDYVIVR